MFLSYVFFSCSNQEPWLDHDRSFTIALLPDPHHRSFYFSVSICPLCWSRNRPQRSDEKKRNIVPSWYCRGPRHYPCFASFSPRWRKIEVAVMSFVTGFHATSSGTSAPATFPTFEYRWAFRIYAWFTGKWQFYAFRFFYFLFSIFCFVKRK